MRYDVGELILISASALVNKLRYGYLPKNVRRIVVFKLDAIGDVVLSTPIYENLKDAFPNAKITVVANYAGYAVLKHDPHIDAIIMYNSARYSKEQYRGIRNDLYFFRSLWKDEYDLVIDLRGNWVTVLYALLGNVRFRADFGTDSIKNRGKNQLKHRITRNLEILQSIDIETPHRLPKVYTSDTEIGRAKNMLPKGLKVAFMPGASRKTKMWPARYYAELGRKIDETVVLLGSKKERELCSDINGMMGGKAVDLSGKISLTELIAVLKECDAFVGNDTGPTHIAAAAGIPTVALFGPENPKQFAPVGKNVRIIHKEMECQPCSKRNCTRKPRCINLITVNEVYEALRNLMKK